MSGYCLSDQAISLLSNVVRALIKNNCGQLLICIKYSIPQKKNTITKVSCNYLSNTNSTRHLQVHNLWRSNLESLLFLISSLSELNALLLLKRCKRSLSTRNFHQKSIEDNLCHKTTILGLQHLLNVNVMHINIIHQGKPV